MLLTKGQLQNTETSATIPCFLKVNRWDQGIRAADGQMRSISELFLGNRATQRKAKTSLSGILITVILACLVNDQTPLFSGKAGRYYCKPMTPLQETPRDVAWNHICLPAKLGDGKRQIPTETNTKTQQQNPSNEDNVHRKVPRLERLREQKTLNRTVCVSKTQFVLIFGLTRQRSPLWLHPFLYLHQQSRHCSKATRIHNCWSSPTFQPPSFPR